MQVIETKGYSLLEIGYSYNSNLGITSAGKASNEAIKEQEKNLFQLIAGCKLWNRPYNTTTHFYVLVPTEKVGPIKELKIINITNLSGFKAKEQIEALVNSLESDKKHILA